ncbi:Outer membrane efflux protein [Lutibacter oricola]|uniref:Outer membrane efflux protein n=1 Tax=Lutibacter oricola TaxID=762486 RepID=A0A1H2YSI6_9FLAO|nr:TolC family protein [Lutibacter oricola]SDX08047.1 Outer membrane efflux protein [Lutibacter oricola]
MNKLFKILLILTLTIICFNKSQAQTSKTDNITLKGSEFNFPPLNAVIDSVLKRSAMLSFRKHGIGVKESTLKSERLYWTKNIGIQATSQYGTISSFSTSEESTSNISTLTTQDQLNYSVGLYLKLPLFDGLNRKHQLKLAKLEVEAAKSMAKAQEEEIRQRVIVLYQELLLKKKLLKIKSNSLSDARVNMQMVEKEFRNGAVPISEYVRISGMTTNMEAAYETAISEFITSKKILEDMAGFVFSLTRSK